jgi:hypothetical protein
MKQRFFVSLILIFGLMSISVGQTFQLKGSIKDLDSKAQINGALVTLRNTSLRGLSDGAGNFLIEEIPSGKYSVSITLQGYTTYEKAIEVDRDLNLGEILLPKYGSEGTGAALQKTIRSTNVSRLLVERPNLMGNTIYGIAPEPKKVEGNYYLDEQWNAASILLYRDHTVMEGYRVRYNINSNTFELMEPEKNLVSTLSGLRIQNIVWMDSVYRVPRYFVNGMDFKEDGVPISGFFEVLVEGKLPLMRRTIAIFKKSNYNTALMVGNRDDQIIKRNIYYYLKEKDLFVVPKRRKDLFLIFEGKEAEMEAFANANAIDVKESSAIFQLFTYYNSLFPGFTPILDHFLDPND